MRRDKENEYFSDGLAEEIINSLVQISGLKVTARTSAFAFRGKVQDRSFERPYLLSGPRLPQPSLNRFPAFPPYFAGTSFNPWMWARSFSFSLQYASRMSESGMSACVNLMVNGRVYMTGSLKVISTSMCP